MRYAHFAPDHGLSPLTRGTHMPSVVVGDGRRFIPAHAGNTKTADRLNQVLAVYPRSRGEHFLHFRIVVVDNGLSPLTRGTHPPMIKISSRHRFIPAHAGNTWFLSGSTSNRSVYPRSRGEHSLDRVGSGRNHGLSPLTRGTQFFQFLPSVY